MKRRPRVLVVRPERPHEQRRIWRVFEYRRPVRVVGRFTV